jgi:hypothetical protein
VVARDVLVKESAAAGLTKTKSQVDKDQEPAAAAVDEPVADRMLLAKVDAVVREVGLARTAGVWRTFDVCAGHCGGGVCRQSCQSPDGWLGAVTARFSMQY